MKNKKNVAETSPLAELLADPMVWRVMDAYRVDRRQLAEMLREMGKKLARRSRDPTGETTSQTPVSEVDLHYRPGVGIMLLNSRNEVFVGRRIDALGPAWQMPQGGVEVGEDARAAAFREMKEEIGTDKAQIIAESKNWLRYDLPADLRVKTRGRRWRGQRQKWFVMRFDGRDTDIRIATAEPEFMDWKWIRIAELPDIIVSFKRSLYADLVAEFVGICETVATQSDR